MLPIVYEDNHLLIVHKTAGILAQGDRTGDPSALDLAKLYIKHKYNKPGAVYLGLAHRIDRPVSGCLIMARTSKALTRINRSFSENQVEKQYMAISDHAPELPSGNLIHYLVKHPERNLVRTAKKHSVGAKKSVLDYNLIGHLETHYLFDVRPQTGRKHQIRVQLSAIGSPIIGDRKYGSSITLNDASIALHCYAMRFEHPVKKELMTVYVAPEKGGVWDVFSGNLPRPFETMK